jgi:predicted RNA-binding protein with PIN domain
MLWLIDGYNVIRRDADLSTLERRSLEDGRAALLGLVARAAAASADDFVVVFDGVRATAAPASARRVRVVFSRPPDKADDVLVRLARQRGPGATVVTSDRTVQDAARRGRAAAVSAERFLARLTESPPAESEPEDEPRPGPKRGNPRRLSRAERQSRRALGRLRPR